MHKHCLLTALISVALSTCFLLPPRTTRIGEHHPQCAGPSNIKHQSGKHLRDLPMGHCDGGIFLTEAPSSQMISTLCQVDRKKKSNQRTTVGKSALSLTSQTAHLDHRGQPSLPLLSHLRTFTDLCTYPIKLALRLKVLNMGSPPSLLYQAISHIILASWGLFDLPKWSDGSCSSCKIPAEDVTFCSMSLTCLALNLLFLCATTLLLWGR